MNTPFSDKSFIFSTTQYISIHRELFTGIYSHAGKIRDYNISKKEWILDGDIVIKQKTASKTSKVTYSLIRLDAITGEILYTGDRSYLYKLYLLPSYFLSEYTIPTFIDQN